MKHGSVFRSPGAVPEACSRQRFQAGFASSLHVRITTFPPLREMLGAFPSSDRHRAFLGFSLFPSGLRGFFFSSPKKSDSCPNTDSGRTFAPQSNPFLQCHRSIETLPGFFPSEELQAYGTPSKKARLELVSILRKRPRLVPEESTARPPVLTFEKTGCDLSLGGSDVPWQSSAKPLV